MHKPSTKEQQVLNRALMRSTEYIDDPTWDDIHDRDKRIEKLEGALADCVIRMDRARSIVNATNKDPQVRYLLYTTQPRKALEDG